MQDLRVLHEDNHVIAVYKPAGLLVQGDKSNVPCLMDEVKSYLKEKYNKPGNVFLGLVHRLDRPVAGIVLFAKTTKGASRLSAQIREHDWVKVYHAVVEGEIKQKEGTLIHWIKKDENKNKVEIFSVARPDALRAELSYEVVTAKAGRTLVKINLKTGRPHQIRAQFSAIGHPIVGDVKYGAKAMPDQSLWLAATKLTFQLPTKEESKTIEISVPFQL